MTISWRAVDVSGVQWSSVSVQLPGGSSFLSCSGMATMTSGTVEDGRWAQTCPILEAAPNGTYSVFIHAYDLVGNQRMQQFDGTAWLWDATFSVTGGSDDLAAPLVSEVSAEPGSVAAGNSVTISWRAVDVSGVHGSSASVWLPGEQSFLQCGMPAMTSGEAADGWWAQTCPILEAAPLGTYGVFINANDLVGNQRHQQLVDNVRVFDTTFAVTS